MNRERWPQPLRAPSDTGSGAEQSDEEKIPYSAARNMSSDSGIIRKPYGIAQWQQAVDEALPDVPLELRKALYLGSGKVTGGREGGHLLRLLSRKGVEHDFGAAFLKFSSEIFRNDKELREETSMILNGELTDTMMWWTYAPYIYRELIEKGIEEKEALKNTLQWAAKSTADDTMSSEYRLPGLEILNEEKVDRYVLSHNPQDITHKFTHQEAKRIVKEVFSIDEKKK